MKACRVIVAAAGLVLAVACSKKPADVQPIEANAELLANDDSNADKLKNMADHDSNASAAAAMRNAVEQMNAADQNMAQGNAMAANGSQ